MAFLTKKLLKRLTPVISTDWPLSLGLPVYVISTDKLARASVRITRKEMKLFMEGESHEGVHAVWLEGHRCVVIAINTRSAGRVRIAELVAHEVSHAVDGFLARAAVAVCDTEWRAYTSDWMVGKILHNFKF